MLQIRKFFSILRKVSKKRPLQNSLTKNDTQKPVPEKSRNASLEGRFSLPVLNFLCGLLLRFYSADVPPCVHFPQREATIYCDITEKAYQNYELMTREPKLEILVRIADLFEVSFDYLTGRTDCRPVKH